MQSNIRNVRMCVCLSVTSRKPHLPVDWRPLVKGHIVNIDMPPHIFSLSFFLLHFDDFLCFIFCCLVFFFFLLVLQIRKRGVIATRFAKGLLLNTVATN